MAQWVRSLQVSTASPSQRPLLRRRDRRIPRNVWARYSGVTSLNKQTRSQTIWKARDATRGCSGFHVNTRDTDEDAHKHITHVPTKMKTTLNQRTHVLVPVPSWWLMISITLVPDPLFFCRWVPACTWYTDICAGKTPIYNIHFKK